MAVEEWPGKAREKWEDFKEWLKSLFPPNENPYRPQQKPPSQQQDADDQPPPPPPVEAEGRYHVQQPSGDLAHDTDNLGDALNAWRSLTNQEGTIVDSETGEDLTPEKDDNGRYAVLDEDGDQIGTFNDLGVAEQVWETETDSEGMIVDTLNKLDVTPYKGHLSDEEVQEAIRLVQGWGGKGFSRGYDRYRALTYVDADEVARLIPIINKLRLPIFELANAVGDSHNLPTRSVTVTKREAEITYKDVEYFEDVPIDDPPTTFMPTPIPQDRTEIRPMREYGELGRVRPIELAMPDFERRYATLDLPIDEDMEELPGDAPAKKVRRTRKEQTITPREWEEEMEVTEEPRVQNLALVVDLSGSMGGPNINVAVALVAVLITKHLHDESRYSFRWFADYVDSASTAESTRAKKQLIEFVLDARSHDQIGGGTNILGGIEAAASDVRSMARSGEIPEVVVITDGDDWNVTAHSVYDIVRQDVILHSVMIGGQNAALRAHSTTYEQLDPWSLGYQHRYYDDRGW